MRARLRVAEGARRRRRRGGGSPRATAPVLAVPLGQRAVGRRSRSAPGPRRRRTSRSPARRGSAANSASSASCLRRKIASRSMCRSRFSAVPAFVRRARRSRRQLVPAGQLLDAQEQRVAVAPARRVVRAGFDRPAPASGAVRGLTISTPAAQPARPAAEACQIREVADPPAVARARRVQLGREAPGAQIVGQEAAARADDEQRLVAAAPKNAVVAERQLVRQRAVAVERRVVPSSSTRSAPPAATVQRRSPPGSRTRTASGSSSGGAAVSGATPMAACNAARVSREVSCRVPRASW